MSQFCLRWNNHQPNFISVFTTLLNTESLVDVTLAAEGKHLQAHKVVLSACSVYFQTLFTTNPSRHPIVIIKDVSYSDLRVLVDFMYYGEVNVTEEQLPRILDTARLLKIKGLTEMPDSTKHSTPPAELDSPERRAPSKDAEAGAEWDRAALPAARSPGAKRRRRKQSDDQPPPTHEADNSLPLGSAADNAPAVSVQQNALFRPEMGNIYTNVVQQRTQEPDDGVRTQQLSFAPHVEHNAGYNHQEQNSVGRMMAPISGIQWVNQLQPGYGGAGDQFPERADAGGGTSGGVAYAGGGTEQQATPANGAGHYDVYDMPLQGVNEAASQRPLETPGKRRRTNNPQAAENFQRAIEAVRFGGIGFCKAARIFGVNNRTLWLEYKKKGYPIHRPSIRERIKREPTEADAAAEPLIAPEVDPEPTLAVTPAPYMLNQSCFQFLPDSSLQGF